MEKLRIHAALKYVTGHSVTIIPMEEWKQLVRFDGDPTLIEVVPEEMTGILSVSSRVAAAGSGIMNPDSGLDIVRHDPQDSPHVYNIYHYKVFENLPAHNKFNEVVTVANVEDSPQLRESLQSNVYLVGPYKLENHHWVVEIPTHIANAKKKE